MRLIKVNSTNYEEVYINPNRIVTIHQYDLGQYALHMTNNVIYTITEAELERLMDKLNDGWSL